MGLFVANLIWLVISWRDRRVAEREYDSICERVRREGRVESDRLGGLVCAHEDTIKNLQSEREESAKRILSLEDSYRDQCKAIGEMNWEINAGRDVRAAAFDLCEMLDQFVKGTDASRAKNLFEPVTFQPKRPEDQPQKPICDN